MYLRRSTRALMPAVTQISARAGIHGSNKHEACRICDGCDSPRDGHFSIFERLPQHLKYISLELREFIQEKNSVMRKTHLTGFWNLSSSYQSDIGSRMPSSA